MSDQHNAYSDWLMIAPHEQPPNYYRLLELPLYEGNPELIRAHARRQLDRVTHHIGGPYRDIAHDIANEITAAGQCLLDPKAKQEYDTHCAS